MPRRSWPPAPGVIIGIVLLAWLISVLYLQFGPIEEATSLTNFEPVPAAVTICVDRSIASYSEANGGRFPSDAELMGISGACWRNVD